MPKGSAGTTLSPKIAAMVDFDFTYRVVADSKYGTIDNFLARYDKGIRARMPGLSSSASVREEKRGIFTETRFRYDRERDIYICPAGQELRFKSILFSEILRRSRLTYLGGPVTCPA